MGSYNPLVVCTLTYGNNKIIATNDGKTSPKFKVTFEDGNTSYSGHAEMRALSLMPRSWNVDRVKVEVHRVKKDGTLAMSKPCIHCQVHLWRYGIKARNVWFTDDAGKWTRFTT